MDAEIQALERRIASGDLTAWDALDLALERAGLRPRRVWVAWARGGEYSDAWENILAIKYAKADALAAMAEHAKVENAKPRNYEWRLDPEDPERWKRIRAGSNTYADQEMSLTWEEVR